MGLNRVNRRLFVLGLLCGLPGAAVVDAVWIEPRWLRVKRVRLSHGKATHRLVHFSDLHYKGDRAFAEKVVRQINAQSPNFVCFTGDIIGDPIENPKHLDAALPILAGIKAPLYGVPGNHEYWSKASFEVIGKTFVATGGAWLVDEQVRTRDGQVTITGLSCQSHRPAPLLPKSGTKNILLLHYPAWVKKLGEARFDLMLAGHSHGGQVRLPFLGPPMVAFAVDEYDKGLFETGNGPLYVNPGIGWFATPIRFRCRPEITVIEI